MLEIKAAKKTNTVQAVQFTGKNAQEIVRWAACNYVRGNQNRLEVSVLNGEKCLTVDEGDYLVKDPEAFPKIKLYEKEVFEEKYNVYPH